MEIKEVFWRPSDSTDVVKIGQPVCYNSDLAADYKERTTNPITANAASNNSGTTYAEGAQTYNARLFVVERPASGNLHQFAGTVLELGSESGADGDKLKIAVPNGAIVAVWTDANCTLDSTLLGPSSGSDHYQAVTGDGDPLPAALAMETVDRSGTNGLVWARVFGLENQFGKYLAPTRGVVSGYAYGLNIDGTNMLTGTAASKSYVVQISGDRETAAATGDSNDALLKITGNNYGACDTNFIFRGLNASINNRSGGVLGRIDHSLGTQGKSGGTVGTILGLTITAENYGTVDDLFGGLDIVLKNEAAVATKEFGIRVRNENNSIAGPVNAVIEISETGANTGFTNLFVIDALGTIGAYASTGDAPALATGDIMIPVKIGATTYYLVALVDTGV
jgi:hypothetical protein